MALRVNIVSLGCSKNLVDSERLAAMLSENGYKVMFDSDGMTFDVVIINTCGFIGDAKQESIDSVLQYADLRSKNRIKLLVVFGCLVQRYKEELEKEIREVDAFFGVDSLEQIASYLHLSLEGDDCTKRLLSTPKHYAYLKISEGCDRHCSFCAIPNIRGRHRSVPLDMLVRQAEVLAAKGVKELMIIAQDTSVYGIDLYGRNRLGDLLSLLAEIDGIQWIRLHYSYPNEFPFDVIELMKTREKICSYIDMPLQHINNRLLKSMNRRITSEQIERLIGDIRMQLPSVCLRTTLIVGYPSETEEEFEQLKRFVQKTRFDRLGAFAYSPEEGTPAYRLKDDVPQKEKQRRLDELVSLQEGISYELNREKIGKTYKVIIDRREGDYWIGRTEYDSPEVDNEVLVPFTRKVGAGDFVNVEIMDAVEFDLYAKITE